MEWWTLKGRNRQYSSNHLLSLSLTGPPMDERLHNGGAMAFDNDGKLYITTGDAGKRANAQPLNNVHGSIIRLNEDGTVPDDNPYTESGGYTNSYRCGDTGGRVPTDASDDAVCAEVWANGLRNPFRIDMDPNVKDKVKFSFGVVGAQHIESIFYGGTDYKGTNYGWPTYEGVCKPGEIENCPVNTDEGITMPFHWYEHISYEDGGCIGGMAHVPEGLWPSAFKYLFIDFILLKIYLLEDNRPDRACPDCFPPLPPTRNETFYRSTRKEEENVNEARMTEMWFGPYKDTQALYVSKFGNLDTIIRIRYNGILNKPPKPAFDWFYNGETIIEFDASRSTDPENDSLTYEWDFGDDTEESMDMVTSHEYTTPGEYDTTLTITDPDGQAQQISKTIKIGQVPKVNIISPIENITFSVGQVLRLQGEAYDFLGNPIPEDQLTWEVRQHHAQHFHPFLDITKGNNFDLYPAPKPEDYLAATNSFLKIILTATDEYGLSNTFSMDVQPNVVMVNVTTSPSGLDIVVDDFSMKTPELFTSWDGFNLPVRVDDQPPYLFRSWSDGDKNRTRTVPIVSNINNTNTTNIKAIFCMDFGTRCENNGDCCSSYCSGVNNICATMPITVTQSPTMKASLSPSSSGPTSSPTINPTKTYLRPTILAPDLELEINVETPPMSRPPPPPLEIDAKKPLENDLDESIESVSINVGVNDNINIDNSKGLDTKGALILALSSIILALLVIGCCYIRLVLQMKDKHYIDSVVEPVCGKGYSYEQSDDENDTGSKSGIDEYFYQPENEIKITGTNSTEDSQDESNGNSSPMSSDDAERDMSLSFLIPESISSEPRYVDDAENPTQVAATELVQSYSMPPLSPVKKWVSEVAFEESSGDNVTQLSFSGAPAVPTYKQNEVDEMLEYRFDTASTSQSSLVPPPLMPSDQSSFDGIAAQRSNSTSFCLSIPSPESVKQKYNCTDNNLDQPSYISDRSFSLLIPHASVSEESFIENDRGLDDPSDAAEALVEDYMRDNSLALPVDFQVEENNAPWEDSTALLHLSENSNNISRDASVVSDKLDEVARELSLLLVDSSDFYEEVLAKQNMNSSTNAEQSLPQSQEEATEGDSNVIEQNQSEEDIIEISIISQDASFNDAEESDYDLTMNENSIEHETAANPAESEQYQSRTSTSTDGNCMGGRDSEAYLLSILNTSESNQSEEENLIDLSQESSINIYGDDDDDKKGVDDNVDGLNVNIDPSSLASPQQQVNPQRASNQPEFFSPEVRHEAHKPKNDTPETQLLAYDVDSSLESMSGYISEPQTPPNFQSKSATNLQSSFAASVTDTTSNILSENQVVEKSLESNLFQ
jgi:PKD repeat protein